MSPRREAKVVLIASILLALAVSVAGIAHWYYQTGCFSRANYERIAKGMDLGQVEALLGSPGEEVPRHGIPGYGHPGGVPAVDAIPARPPGEVGVIWGDRVFIWRSGRRTDDTIYVGMKDGKVVSKFYHYVFF